MVICSCGSLRAVDDCCASVQHNQALAVNAVQLMRARYHAYTTANIDFIVDSYHSSAQAHLERAGIEESTRNHWIKLEIIDAPPHDSAATQAFVEFKAWYMPPTTAAAQNNALQVIHERSRFVKEAVDNKMLWRYIDGTFPDSR